MAAPTPARDFFLMLSCEHAGNRVPEAWSEAFAGAEADLNSHRGCDEGALPLALRLASDLGAPLLLSTVSRLVVEPNRSLDNPGLWSEYTRGLHDDDKREILAEHYTPLRSRAVQLVDLASRAGMTMLHLSIHSFTPVFEGVRRSVEVGVLFDPVRKAEKRLAERWIEAIRGLGLDARANEPYEGVADGHTTALRRQFPSWMYIGLELEVRSDLLTDPAAAEALAARLGRTLLDSMHE
ncbi:MAG: N-formylglutamate amidohydrolase [Phycisphaerales bacterium]|nr:N-formylglutamate amidohydrolase [Phycisphaerales bacterium]